MGSSVKMHDFSDRFHAVRRRDCRRGADLAGSSSEPETSDTQMARDLRPTRQATCLDVHRAGFDGRGRRHATSCSANPAAAPGQVANRPEVGAAEAGRVFEPKAQVPVEGGMG